MRTIFVQKEEHKCVCDGDEDPCPQWNPGGETEDRETYFGTPIRKTITQNICLVIMQGHHFSEWICKMVPAHGEKVESYGTANDLLHV